MTEKIVGYILLAVGVLLIGFSGFSVYRVFTKRSEPVKLFSFGDISLNTGQSVQALKGSPLAGLVSGNVLDDTSNIFAHFFMMGFIATTGYKLASIGAMLIRPIKVKLKGMSPPKESPEKK